jgi:hydrogenase maturation protease
MGGILVIGYGNPLRGDDGLGWHAASRLAGELEGTGAEVLVLHQLAPEVAQDLSRAALAVFIDAGCEGTPGELRVSEVLPDASQPGSFSHQVNPAVLLALAAQLYGSAPRAWMVSVVGEAFGHGENLSPRIGEMLPAVCARVREVIRIHGDEHDEPDEGDG